MAQGDITTRQEDVEVNLHNAEIDYNIITYIEGPGGNLYAIDSDAKHVKPANLTGNEWVVNTDTDHHKDITDLRDYLATNARVQQYIIDNGFVFVGATITHVIEDITTKDADLGIITYITNDYLTDENDITWLWGNQGTTELVPASPSEFGGYSFTDQSQLPDEVKPLANSLWTTEITQAYITWHKAQNE